MKLADSDMNVFAKYGIRKANELKLAMNFLKQGYSHEEAAELTKKKIA